jgi:hypothetical protein
MQCYLAAPDERLVCGQEAVQLNCLEQLQLISGEGDQVDVQDLNFPALPPLTLDEVQWLQFGCSYGKGHTPDGFSDIWVRRTERREILSDLWNAPVMRQLARIFEARLVPLNKAWPDIPKAD